MISPLESHVLDANCECLGIPVSDLMDNAGRTLAEEIDALEPKNVLFICGSGNNGGDGYTASRYCRCPVTVTAFRPPKSELCRSSSAGVRISEYDSVRFEDYDLIVDCVLGTGLTGDLRPEYTAYIERLNAYSGTVVACDVPSGFGTGTCVEADVTVTFHEAKTGMDSPSCGTVIIADIGIPEEASALICRGDFLRYPVPCRDSHKGQNGRLIVVGGGPYIGAPAMAAMAALRVGTDLVTIMTPKKSFVQIGTFTPAYMVKELSGDILVPGDVQRICDECSKADALLIGPGLGRDPETAEAVRALAERSEVPIVFDADAIAMMRDADMPLKETCVFTAHSREYESIVDGDVNAFCGRRDCVVLKKGREDVISCSERSRVNRSGCPAMTVGGTGDVLAGIVAGLLAKGMSAFDAACLGAHISGLAGEKAFEEKSYGLIPTDVIEKIPDVLKEAL